MNAGIAVFVGVERSVSNCSAGRPAIADGTDRTTCAVDSGVAFVSKESVPVSVTLGAAVRSKVAAGIELIVANSVSAAAESERGATERLQLAGGAERGRQVPAMQALPSPHASSV